MPHFYADYIGSVDTVITDFDVNTTLVPNDDVTSKVNQEYSYALTDEGLQPIVGDTFELGMIYTRKRYFKFMLK